MDRALSRLLNETDYFKFASNGQKQNLPQNTTLEIQPVALQASQFMQRRQRSLFQEFLNFSSTISRSKQLHDIPTTKWLRYFRERIFSDVNYDKISLPVRSLWQLSDKKNFEPLKISISPANSPMQVVFDDLRQRSFT